jgi:hypothetical protein
VRSNVARVLGDYEAAIRRGVKKFGMLEAADAGAGSTVLAILNRVLIDEHRKIFPDFTCCTPLSQDKPRRRCVRYALPPVE